MGINGSKEVNKRQITRKGEKTMHFVMETLEELYQLYDEMGIITVLSAGEIVKFDEETE